MLSKVLIDTNIIIGLEDNKEVGAAYSELSAICSKHGISLRIHESSTEDVQRDNDLARKAITLSKLRKYQVVKKTPRSNEQKEVRFGKIKSPNDAIDIDLLVSLEIGVVDILVTEDKELAKRVRGSPLEERVFTVDSALHFLKATLESEVVSYPHVEDKTCNQLDISDPFFTSLSTDYSGFAAWFSSCVGEERECWCIQNDGKLGGLIIYKEESDKKSDQCQELKELGVPGSKILKICLFKMSDNMRGGKYGEQLLKKAMDYGFRNSYDSMYLTTYEKQSELIALIQKFGFERGNDKRDERVYYKLCKPKSDTAIGIDYHKKYWPAIKYDSQKFYIIPIKPNFHDRLFPEISLRFYPPFHPHFQIGLLESRESLVPGNAIRKVYVCNANVKAMEPGSVLYFYRSSDQLLTTVGVLESFSAVSNIQELKAAVGIRSVYKEEELSDKISGNKVAKVLNFYYAENLEQFLSLESMRIAGILKGQPQSISKLESDVLLNALSSIDKGIFFEQ